MKIQHNKIVMLGAVLALGCITTVSLSAQTAWISDSDGLWQDSGNWNNGAPASNDVTINNEGAKTITLDDSAGPPNLSVTSVKLSGAGNVLELANANSTLNVDGSGNGLEVSGGGTLQIDGGNLNIVNSGNISDSGTVSLLSGNVTVGHEVVIGGDTVARLEIAGGSFSATTKTYIGFFGTSSGEVNVTGGIFRTDLNIGAGSVGTAKLTVSGAGVFESLGIYAQNTTDIVISNGGAIQFTTASPYIGETSEDSSLKLDGGVVSYRGVSGANIANANVAKFDFTGNNAFRLNGSSNDASLASYTFNTGENYQALQLTGTNSVWTTTGATTIGAGGELRAFDATDAVVNAELQSAGAIRIENSRVSFQKNVTVTSTGALLGDAAGIFDFQKDVTIQSANAAGSDLQQATFRFSGGGNHTLDLAESGFSEDGDRIIGQSNFDLGALKIDVGNKLTLLGDTGTNALYISLFDLTGWDVSPGELDSSLTNALSLADGINIYYDSTLAGNSYLNAQNYDLWGGGQLIAAIPEVSTIHLVLAGLVICAVLHRKRQSA